MVINGYTGIFYNINYSVSYTYWRLKGWYHIVELNDMIFMYITYHKSLTL
ncbi:hypothetical protein Barb4_04693 [Bacteroidales bacterium Barb4]|nr:hypothetical protein Barb4_04693 [Bacteroidales bacterium Barb4]